MITPPAPKALLLASGGVLMRPIGGRWHPRPDFEATVRAHAPRVTDEQLAEAIAAGDRFMAAATATPDLDDYHRAMLARIAVPATPELLADLVREVPPASVLETFPEVIPTLDALRARGVPMAVVSDAWPDLPDLHAALGLNEYFDAIRDLGGARLHQAGSPDVPARQRGAADGTGRLPVRGRRPGAGRRGDRAGVPGPRDRAGSRSGSGHRS